MVFAGQFGVAGDQIAIIRDMVGEQGSRTFDIIPPVTVQLPSLMVSEQIKEGSLIQLLDDWSAPPEIIHLVSPSRRGSLPAVRALIDFLAERYASFEED